MGTVEDSHIIVINLVSLGPRPYAWEIWHRAEARSVHVAYAKYATFGRLGQTPRRREPGGLATSTDVGLNAHQ